MAGLVPAIHALFVGRKTWMPGTRPGMTLFYGEGAAKVGGVACKSLPL